MPDLRPILHLTAPAGSCRNMLGNLGCASAGELIDLVQRAVAGYRVTGDAVLINADEDEEHGGRHDDARRALDFRRALGNERVAAIVTLRGGSWLTRILPRIDFDVLRRRRSRVAIFGFSELTTVVNIAASYPKAVCWYDMGPAFVPTGLQRWARLQTCGKPRGAAAVKRWARGQFPDRLAGFFADVVNMIEGRGSARLIRGELAAGKLPAETAVTIVGGCLSVLVSLLGTPYARSVFRPGRWLALEDVNEAPHRIDRLLAHLRLTGVLDRCAGLLLGDFHENEHDRIESVLASLRRILPARSPMPIVVSRNFGHTWPMSPLPIGRTVCLRRRGEQVELDVPWGGLAVRSA